MSLKIAGAVIELLEEQSGTGKNGPWHKQDFILETEGQYKNKVCITQWGENIEKFALKPQDRVTVHIDIQSREYNGRWYTDVKAWRIEREEAGSDAGAGTGPGEPAAGPGASGAGPGAPGAGSPPPTEEGFDEDDLPF
ncbi:MAG: DUF3127 domain-containing protein [Gemmatimonadota bacterium]